MNTTQQINPPFDGSAPCPMCPQAIRAISATAHNLLNRWPENAETPESKFWTRLGDLAAGAAGAVAPGVDRDGVPLEQLKSDNADVTAHLEAIGNLTRAYREATAQNPPPTVYQVTPTLRPLVEALRKTQPAINKLSEEHFDDQRHSMGRPNILREQRGYSVDRGGNYDWTVVVVPAQPGGTPGEFDLLHQVCRTGLVIHEHYQDRIRKDRLFYGQVWCPTCQINAPWQQFECRVVGGAGVPA